MASVLTVKAFLEKVSLRLTDMNPQFKRWKQPELLAYMNDGYLAIAKYMPWTFARTDAIRLKPGTRQSIELIPQESILVDGVTPATKPMRGSMLLSADYNLGSTGMRPGRAIVIVDKDVLDRSNPMWHDPRCACTEVIEYTYDPRVPKQFYVNPGVAASTPVWAMLTIAAEPELHVTTVDFTADPADDTPISVADSYADELQNFVLARAYMKDAEVEGSANMVAAHTKLFVDSVNALVKARTGVNPNLKSLPLNPSTDATAS